MLVWMAWTWQTGLLFALLFAAMGTLLALELARPGKGERRGVFGLVTTRGDRLFMTLLGSSFIFFAWLGFFGTPLWAPLGIALAWGVFCFWKA